MEKNQTRLSPSEVARKTRNEQGMDEQVHVTIDRGVIELVSCEERQVA